MTSSSSSRKLKKRRSSEEKEEEIKRKFVSSDVCGLEILPRLSAKHVQTLKIVCKDWLQLISSAYFVRLHFDRANRSRILVKFHSNIIDYYEKTTQIIPSPHQCRNSTRIMGSADGLICFLGDPVDSVIAIFNPSTGKSSVLQLRPPEIILNFCFWWFGNHPAAGEYAVVLGMFAPGLRLKFGVYKLTKTKLKRIHSDHQNLMFCFRPLQQRGTFVHGVVYWPAEEEDSDLFTRQTILAYDLNNNVHREISPPAQANNFRLGVHVDGCLCATLKNKQRGRFELWIMKDDGWTKYANIHIRSHHQVLSPLGFFPNGDMVLDVDKYKAVKYSFNRNRPKLLLEYGCSRNEAIMYADTLVSPQIWEV